MPSDNMPHDFRTLSYPNLVMILGLLFRLLYYAIVLSDMPLNWTPLSYANLFTTVILVTHLFEYLDPLVARAERHLSRDQIGGLYYAVTLLATAVHILHHRLYVEGTMRDNEDPAYPGQPNTLDDAPVRPRAAPRPPARDGEAALQEDRGLLFEVREDLFRSRGAPKSMPRGGELAQVLRRGHCTAVLAGALYSNTKMWTTMKLEHLDRLFEPFREVSSYETLPDHVLVVLVVVADLGRE